MSVFVESLFVPLWIRIELRKADFLKMGSVLLDPQLLLLANLQHFSIVWFMDVEIVLSLLIRFLSLSPILFQSYFIRCLSGLHEFKCRSYAEVQECRIEAKIQIFVLKYLVLPG